MWNASNGTRVVGTLLISVVGVAVIACGSTTTISTSDGTPEPLTSFFIEARVQGEADEGAGPFPPVGPVVSNLRWWFEAPDRFRWELETIEPVYFTGSSIMVTEDDQWIAYDSNLNRFQLEPAVQFPGRPFMGPPSSVLIGPLQAESVADWVTLNRLSQPRFDARLLRVEELFGRRVGVYEFSPVGVYLDTAGTIAAGGTGRIWIDESSQLVLKYEGTDSHNVIAEVTKLEVNKKIDTERFTFIAPPGALEAERSTGPITLSGSVGVDGRPSTPSGLLEIGYVPEFGGVSSGGSSSGQSMGVVNQAENTWTFSDGRALRVRQSIRASGFPYALVSDEQIYSSASSAGPYNVLRSDDRQMISLAWQDGDIFILVDGVGMDVHFLLRVARSIFRPGTEIPVEG